MSYCGDNINMCHDMEVLIDFPEHILCYCKNCKRRYHVNPMNKMRYNELFKKDTLQPGLNLYYKYFGKMDII